MRKSVQKSSIMLCSFGYNANYMSHKITFPPKSFLKVIPTTFAPSFRILFRNEVYKCKVCKIKINNIGKLLCSFVLIYYEHKRVEGRDATVVCIYRVLGNEGIKSNRER